MLNGFVESRSWLVATCSTTGLCAVAGIAAGNYRTKARGRRISGVAPKAYLGNYKVLSIPTPEVGLDGNAAEIVAGIEAAVRDGMDVINFSGGGPQADPRTDAMMEAVRNVVRAGVVPIISAIC